MNRSRRFRFSISVVNCPAVVAWKLRVFTSVRVGLVLIWSRTTWSDMVSFVEKTDDNFPATWITRRGVPTNVRHGALEKQHTHTRVQTRNGVGLGRGMPHQKQLDKLSFYSYNFFARSPRLAFTYQHAHAILEPVLFLYHHLPCLAI
jgi:hypothetical protein